MCSISIKLTMLFLRSFVLISSNSANLGTNVQLLWCPNLVCYLNAADVFLNKLILLLHRKNKLETFLVWSMFSQMFGLYTSFHYFKARIESGREKKSDKIVTEKHSVSTYKMEIWRWLTYENRFFCSVYWVNMHERQSVSKKKSLVGSRKFKITVIEIFLPQA